MISNKVKLTEHRADSRGQADHGWLISRHTFSFAGYFDPKRVQFGALRVLNDDIVKPGMGFGTHPHENMEIISIPLEGALAHKDSTGREEAIRTGEVQIMSAGSGITHSEYNHSKDQKVNFLQIWIFPREKNITPQYDQRFFDLAGAAGKLVSIVAPDDPEALWINQDAWLYMGNLPAATSTGYTLKKQNNGTYIFVIDGEIQVEGVTLARRDALGIEGTDRLEISATKDSNVLLMDVPMNY